MIEAGEFGRISAHRDAPHSPHDAAVPGVGLTLDVGSALAGGGAMLNLGGHGMDLARMLVGPELSVASAVISNRVHQAEVEDYALATLRNGDGTLVHVEVGYTWPTWPANESDLEFKVAGEKATLRVVPDGLQVIGPGRDDRFPGAASAAGNYPPLIRDTARARGTRRPSGDHRQGLRERHPAGFRRLSACRTHLTQPGANRQR